MLSSACSEQRSAVRVPTMPRARRLSAAIALGAPLAPGVHRAALALTKTGLRRPSTCQTTQNIARLTQPGLVYDAILGVYRAELDGPSTCHTIPHPLRPARVGASLGLDMPPLVYTEHKSTVLGPATAGSGAWCSHGGGMCYS